MRSSDLDAVMAIEEVSFPTPWPRRFFEREVAADGLRVAATVALADREIVGYMVAWNMAGEIHLGNVAVSPTHRRRRVGQALLDRLVAQAEEEGASCITLEVRASNRGAITLYARNKFRPAGLRHGYYRGQEDAIVMIRDLERR